MHVRSISDGGLFQEKIKAEFHLSPAKYKLG